MSYGDKKARERANLAKLPEIAYANHPETGQVVAIKRGERGYFPIDTRMTSAQLNMKEGVKPAQAAAMLAGSMRGWAVPEADPDYQHHILEEAAL